jgi:hypothetical protein
MGGWCTAIALELHSYSSAPVDIVMVFAAAGVDAVGGAAAASSDRAQVVVSRGLARPASVAAEEGLALDVLGLEMMMRFLSLVPSAAILQVVEELVEVLAVRAHCAAVVAVIGPAVLWRRRRAGRPGSRTMSISAPRSASSAFFMNAPASAWPGARHTHIPVLLPLRQIRMVHPAVAAHMLSGSHYHILRGRDVYDRRFARVGVRHPYCYRKAVCRTAKRNW